LPPDERRASALSEAIVIARNAQNAAPPMSAAHRLAGRVGPVRVKAPRVGGIAGPIVSPGARVQCLMLILVMPSSPSSPFFTTAIRPTAFDADGSHTICGRRCTMISEARD
jgi:hypothetical protein